MTDSKGAKMDLREHLKWLGLRVREVATGLSGVVVSVSFDLCGCVQAYVKPAAEDGVVGRDGSWFDVTRLIADSTERVMELPAEYAIEPSGPVEKAAPR